MKYERKGGVWNGAQQSRMGAWWCQELSPGAREGRCTCRGWGMGDKALGRKGSAEFKVAVGHPVRALCVQESSWPKTEV